MNQMFKSATFKLTLWYLCLAEFISIIFSFVVYNIGTREIFEGIRSQANRIYANYPIFDNDDLLHPDRDISKGDHLLLIRLVILNILVLVLAGLASYWLAKRTLKPIEEAHEQQKRFTADVSHELRTPLTAIKMEDEVVLQNQQAGKGELKKTISSNLEEVSRLENMINNLLVMSSLEANTLQEKFGPVSVKDISQKALYEVKNKASGRGIKIQSSIRDATINGDRDSLIQLLVIILDNAIKYSNSGSNVEYSVTTEDRGVTIKITDHGAGIKKEALDHIFDRFYQAEVSRNKKDNEGYGLGLSIAKNIADIHGAVISVSSQYQKGTMVQIVFPVQ